MKKILIFIFLTISIATTAYPAVTWHLKAGYAKPRLDMDGYFIVGEFDYKFYAKRHFGFKPVETDHWYVDIGIPFLPNVKIENQPFAVYGKKWMKFPKGVELFGINFEAYDKVQAEIVFHINYDVTFYYDIKVPLFFTTLKVKPGILVKWLKGWMYGKAIKLKQEEKKYINTMGGAFYLGFETELPLVYIFSLGLETDFKGFAYLNTWYVDIKAITKLKLTAFRNIGVIYWGVGYKYWHMVLKKLPNGEPADPQMDIKMDDYFTELGIEF
ncbi:MAG: hypothetical protein GXO22_05270 [Aquificae bacterium]|nr:hypothetical protein [Aquificota bacterium]